MRYLRLFLYFVRFSVSRAMEFRFDFTFRIVMDCIYYCINIGFYKILLLHTLQVGGWKEPEIMIFVSSFLLIDALTMTLFSNNLWWIPTFVNRGDLDYYLVRPVSSFFFLTLRDFAVNSFVNLWISVGIFVWAIHHYPEPFSFFKILFFILLLLNGAFLHLAVQVLFVIPVFWLHSNTGLREIAWSFSRVMERPDRIFTGWFRKLFVFILPFCLMTSFPTRLLLERFDFEILLEIVGVTACFWVVVFYFWRLGLRSYSSASS